ncbi:hyaluronan mediated motility receptor-like isoform X2 [Oncorhynchus keta]|uniref:hyaluronan mediated motility receptor-like isoform X2 n=1 Tax=Oncorhynchus keta TaxID=8018 RepID=UPI00227B30B1|nr:hyaluronan mediated motility receptor-like isoform X2 [Oncorhynchus keta]
MSFSRAPVKRFNENIGCAPAPGTYELKPGEVKGPASFLRSERFKLLKASVAPSILPPSPSKDVPTSPVAVRRTMSVDGLVDGSMSKKDKSGQSMQMKRQKLLEKEIRSLVQQRGEQDRRLVTLEEELRKVDAKLLSVVREKNGLAANVTTLERQLAELKKTNEFLKNKVSADTTKKRFQSMSMELMEARNKLDVKDKELSFLQISTGGQVMLLETDLEAARATLTTLRERNEDLSDLHHDTKVHNEELEDEMGTLQAVIQELREEVNVLQGYLDTANDHTQDLRMKLREKTEMENSMSESQHKKLGHLEQKLEQCTAELRISQNILHQKEEESEKGQQDLQASRDALQETEKLLEWREAELMSSQKALGDMETQMQRANQEVSDSQSAVRQQDAEVVRLSEVLRRTVKELDERIAHLGEKCKILEEERNRGQGRVEELTAELSLLQENWRSEKEVQEQLAQAHTSLTEELKKEKERAASLASGLERVREETEDERKQLEDELDEALVELSVLELQEERREEEEKRREEALHSFQQVKTEMERELTETRALLDRRSSAVEALEKVHGAETRRLQEEHTTSLSKIGHMATELESTRQALKGAEDRSRALEDEVERVTKQMERVNQQEEEVKKLREEMEEEQEKHLANQRGQEKARKEYARILLEVQTRLAQRDDEMKRAEEEVQRQLQEERMEKGEVQRLLQQAREEKEELQRLFKQTKEGVQRLLEQEKGEGEVQGMSEEVGGRERLVEVVEEEKLTLQCLVLEVEKENLSLQNQLEKVEDQVKKYLPSLENHMNEVEKERDDLKTAATFEIDKQGLQNQVELMEEKVSLQSQVDVEVQEFPLQSQVDVEVQEFPLQSQVDVEVQEFPLQSQVDVEVQEFPLQSQVDVEVQEKGRGFQRMLLETQDKSDAETEHWRRRYEELYAKVKPFQEQLNGFAAERELLLNENGANQEELTRLADAYARLLGHQNQKQKIRHVVKLKDENISLKQELSKLRAQVSRQKKGGQPQRRVDPSKAFNNQDSKENLLPHLSDTPAFPLAEHLQFFGTDSQVSEAFHRDAGPG